MVTLPTLLFGVAATVAAAISTTALATVFTQFRLWPPGSDVRKAALH